MKTDLDTWMADLASQPADRSLGDLDAEIRRDISNRRWQGRAIRAMAPARVIALSVAVAIGAFAGGAMAITSVRAQPLADAFSVGSSLAPSTLLEGI